jgi:rhodanese-related sulfurtransferase
VGGREHWEQGHIPGAVFADLLGDLVDRDNEGFVFPMPPAAQFAEAMSRYGVGPDTRVVLYDDMVNIWATRVSWMLRAFGFDNAAVLNGGWGKWTTEGRPTSIESPDVAAGRRPNSDTLNLEAAGVEVGPGGGIVVNDEFETTVEGVWAFGDVTDLMPLKHVSVRQARNLIRQLFFGEHPSLDYDLVPHSTFSHPQIAAVGRTEEALRAAGVAYHVGRHELWHTARGMALQENGLAKILVDEGGRILGGHIVGPHASILIQEVVVAMQAGGAIEHIVEAVHAHPALPQLVEEAAKAAQLAVRTSRRAD